MEFKKIIVVIMMVLMGGFGVLMGIVGLFFFITVYMRTGEAGSIGQLFTVIGFFALSLLSMFGIYMLWSKFFAV